MICILYMNVPDEIDTRACFQAATLMGIGSVGSMHGPVSMDTSCIILGTCSHDCSQKGNTGCIGLVLTLSMVSEQVAWKNVQEAPRSTQLVSGKWSRLSLGLLEEGLPQFLTKGDTLRKLTTENDQLGCIKFFQYEPQSP